MKMKIKRYVPPTDKQDKAETSNSYLTIKYAYIHREVARFTNRQKPPRTLGKPPKTEGA
jgi:hypothetical protein